MIPLGLVRTPAAASNCTFGGPHGQWLFVTAVDTVWCVEMRVTGPSASSVGSSSARPGTPVAHQEGDVDGEGDLWMMTSRAGETVSTC